MGHPPLYVTFSIGMSICSIILHHFLVCKCKMMISLRVFFIFSKFWFFWVVRGVKRQKISPKWKIKITSVTCCISERVACDHDFWYTWVKWWYIQPFFHFFKFLIFRLVRRVKVQKMVQNDKKFYQAPYLRTHTSCDCYLW